MTPASRRHAVAFCVDAGYLPFAAHAAMQVAALDPDDRFDILICSATPLTLPPALDGGRVRCVHVDAAVEGMMLKGHVSVSAYLLLHLAEHLGDAYDRVFYLDADIFVQGGDFAALMDVDLAGRSVGAVRDMIQWLAPRRHAEEFRIMGLPHAPYFNSGAVLIDTAAWRGRGVTARAVELSVTRGDEFPLHDQSVLNVALHNDWAELSPTWNWHGFKSTRLAETMVHPNVMHFTSPVKPWNDTDDLTPPRFSRPIHDFVTRHFPDTAILPPGRPALNARRMRRLAIRTWKIAPGLARYLSRFPTDLTVHT